MMEKKEGEEEKHAGYVYIKQRGKKWNKKNNLDFENNHHKIFLAFCSEKRENSLKSNLTILL